MVSDAAYAPPTPWLQGACAGIVGAMQVTDCVEFRVLGPLEIARDGRVVEVGSAKQRALLAALLVHPGEVVSRDRLIDILWGEHPPPSAPDTVQVYIARLRKRLGDGVLVTRPPGYVLAVERRQLDLCRFEDLVTRGRAALPDRPQQAAEQLGAALSLWRGTPLAEFADEEFARADVIRLEGLRQSALEARVDAELALGHHHEVVGELEAAVETDPLNEGPCAQLMLALYRCGRHADALDVYRTFHHRLVEQLGTDPSGELRQLERDILQGHPRLEWVPPERAETPGNLPLRLTSFVGRDSDVARIAGVLEGARLVTLTGAGGVGKSRLAEEVARSMSDHFPDGVWLCELAPVVHGTSVPAALATTLSVERRQGRSLAESLVESLRPNDILLVVDNCEHVVDAAAQLLEELLSACQHASVLATSRIPLGIDGERVWPVRPLEVVSDEGESPAERLFRDRAQAADPFVEAGSEAGSITEICRRLDGIPLAIELAAQRTRSMSVTDIAEALEEGIGVLARGRTTTERHRTLRATLDWSYDLMTSTERQLFARLSVFAGPFGVDAAKALWGGESIEAEAVSDMLADLVDRSMVAADTRGSSSYYSLLEPLRRYGRERLNERGEGVLIERRHAEHYAAVAEQVDIGIRGPNEAHYVALVERELGNLRAAHTWALHHDDVDIALRISAGLFWYAEYRVNAEVHAWAEHVARGVSTHALLPVVWASAAAGMRNAGDLTHAAEMAERGLAATAGPHDPARRHPLLVLADVMLFQGRLEEAAAISAEMTDMAETAGDSFHAVIAMMVRSLALTYRGDEQASFELAQDAHDRARRVGNPSAIGWSLYAMGETLIDRDPDRVQGLLQEVIALAGPVRSSFLGGVARVAEASVSLRHRDPHAALASFGSLIDEWHRLGNWTQQWITLRNLVELFDKLELAEPAAVLYGALNTARSGAPAFGAAADRLSGVRRRLESSVGRETFSLHELQGRALGDEEVIAFASAAVERALANGPGG
ncbi:MAG: winged helix-turn-helix domain-containing protein [Actinomycetota bacterium]|nr:winged helix-turn-helix domain-containing protein [Actinomycetota bacterium]